MSAYEGVKSHSWHACGRSKKWGVNDGLRLEMVSDIVADQDGVRIDTCASQEHRRTRDHRVSLNGAALIKIACDYLRKADAFESLCQALPPGDQARLARALMLPRTQLVDIASDGAGIAELVDQMQIIVAKMSGISP